MLLNKYKFFASGGSSALKQQIHQTECASQTLGLYPGPFKIFITLPYQRMTSAVYYKSLYGRNLRRWRCNTGVTINDHSIIVNC